MFSCNVCKGTVFDNSDDYSKHLVSEEHLKTYVAHSSHSSEDTCFSCETCGTKHSGITPYQQHFKSKKHLKRVKQLQIMEQIKEDSHSEESREHSENHNTNFSDAIPMEIDNSLKSAELSETLDNRMSPTATKGIWSCDVCRKVFSDHTTFSGHFYTECHLNNLTECESRKEKLQTGGSFDSVNFPDEQQSEVVDKTFCYKEYLLQSFSAESDCNLNYNATSLHSQPSGIEDVLPEAPDITSTSDEQVEFFCKVCKIACTGFIPYSEHMMSKKHKKEQEKQKLLSKISNTTPEKLQQISQDPSGKQDRESQASPSTNVSYSHVMCENDSSLMLDNSLSEDDSPTNINLPAFANIIKCTLCDVPCSGLIPYQQHMSSQKHMKMEKKKLFEEFMKNSSPTSELGHLDSTTKQTKLEYSRINTSAHSASLEKSQTRDTSNDNDLISFDIISSGSCITPSIDESLASDDVISCDVCEIKCTGIIPYTQHIASVKHKKMVEKKKLLEEYNKEKQIFCQGNVSEHHKNIMDVKQQSDTSNTNSLDFSQESSFNIAGKSNTQFYASSENLTSSSENTSPCSEGTFICHTCEVSCSGVIPYEQHIHSQKHAKCLQKKKALQRLSNSYNEKSVGGDTLQKQSFNESSLDSTDSSANLSLTSDDESIAAPPIVLKCKACIKSFSGLIPFDQHMESNKHKHNLEKLELLQKIQNKQNSNSSFSENLQINHKSTLKNFNGMGKCTHFDTSLASDDMIGETSRKTLFPSEVDRLNSDQEGSVIVIEDGCTKCGIGEFASEVDRIEHFQTKEHLQFNSLEDFELESECSSVHLSLSDAIQPHTRVSDTI